MKTVLIVEDSPGGRDIYASVLESRGYQVRQACDGAECVRKAVVDPPDLVIMNLSIPLVNGADAIEILKGHPATEHVPVVVLTGHTHPSVREGAWQAGCDDYLNKPLLPSRLVDVVTERIGASD